MTRHQLRDIVNQLVDTIDAARGAREWRMSRTEREENEERYEQELGMLACLLDLPLEKLRCRT